MRLPTKLATLDALILALVAAVCMFSVTAAPIQVLAMTSPVLFAAGAILFWRVWVISSGNPLFSLRRALVEGGTSGAALGVSITLFIWATASWAAGGTFDGFNPARLADWLTFFEFLGTYTSFFAVGGTATGGAVWLIHHTLARRLYGF